jgi:MFS family permease
VSSTDSLAALRIPEVRRFAAGRLSSVLAAQMLSVAVGWELYERTGSAFALGLVGLIEIVPVVLLSLPAGQAADRFRRRDLAMGAHSLLGACAAGLAMASALHAPVWVLYVLIFFTGVAGTFRSPAVGAMLPQLVPSALFTNANAWMSSGTQLAAMAGPALGGLVIAATRGASWVYALAGAAHLFFVVVLATLPRHPPAHSGKGASVQDALAGWRFIFRNKVFLGAMTLDLFAVLLGGATALLPIFAKDILHAGPTGLGWLRAAPSIGAFSMAVVQTHLKGWKNPGRVLLWTVVGFGAATVVFGLSRTFWLSFAALAFTGLFDNISVVIRLTLEQALTPDSMRGRVSAIHYVFIGFSNELGSFESGATAALFGPIASVVGGGIGTILVVIAVFLLWPQITRLGPLNTLQPLQAPDLEPEARPANSASIAG